MVGVKDKGYSQGQRKPALLREELPFLWASPYFFSTNEKEITLEHFLVLRWGVQKTLARLLEDVCFSKRGVSSLVGRNAPSLRCKGCNRAWCALKSRGVITLKSFEFILA